MKWLANLLWKQKLKKVSRKVKTHNFDSARTAIILYDCSTEGKEKEGRDFARFVKEHSIEVTTLAFFNKKGKQVQKPKDELSYHYLEPKDLNWLQTPNTKVAQSIMSTEYDLLFDLNLEGHFCLQYVAGLSKASCKVGASGAYRDQVCDLTLKVDLESRAQLIQEIKKYLAIINKKTA
ncbi:MAG: hypothetical protein RIC95_06430 [Vicingaceae bacterium]